MRQHDNIDNAFVYNSETPTVAASPQPTNPAQVTDAMVEAAYQVFAGKMLMREEDRDLIERVLVAALAVRGPTAPEDAFRAGFDAGEATGKFDDDNVDDAWSRYSATVGASTPSPEAQIEHMVRQFLRWKLPDDFSPDGGIQFVKKTDYGHTFDPVGTNLFDYRQAKAMVQHMLEGLSAAIGAGGQAVTSLDDVAARLWKADAEDTGTPASVANGRTREAFDDQAEELKARWRKFAKAASPALSQPHPADERLGRFGHHPDPAIDFEVEVGAIEAELLEARGGPFDQIKERIDRAMTFRVGGDEISIKAKQALRDLDKQVMTSLHPADERVVEVLRSIAVGRMTASDAAYVARSALAQEGRNG